MSPIKSVGEESEERVKQKLKELGLHVRKPIPDIGVDLEAWFPSDPTHIVKIQVKGRNPEKVKSLRWFQLRVTRAQLERARANGAPADSAWQEKLAKADFLVLDAINTDETWILSHEQALRLIHLNETRYGHRRDNTFTFDESLLGKQKEMNMDIVVDGKALTEYFSGCLRNYNPIVTFLKIKGGRRECHEQAK